MVGTLSILHCMGLFPAGVPGYHWRMCLKTHRPSHIGPWPVNCVEMRTMLGCGMELWYDAWRLVNIQRQFRGAWGWSSRCWTTTSAESALRPGRYISPMSPWRSSLEVKQGTWVWWWDVAWLVGDWTPTQNKHYITLFTIHKTIQSHISHTTLTPEQIRLSLTPGRERTDHPDTKTLLDLLPDTLWPTGSTDVGLLNVPPVSIPVKTSEYQIQYLFINTNIPWDMMRLKKLLIP